MFDIEWRGRRVALRASNGRYVCTKRNGQLAAVSDTVGKFGGDREHRGVPGMLRAGCCAGEDEEFTLKLINRPMLVLRGEHGFVCYHRGSNLLDSNRSVYDVFHITFSDGAYQIQGGQGGLWGGVALGVCPACTDTPSPGAPCRPGGQVLVRGEQRLSVQRRGPLRGFLLRVPGAGPCGHQREERAVPARGPCGDPAC